MAHSTSHLELEMTSEGRAQIEVSKLETYRSSNKEYVPSKAPVFYNPLMKTNRDIAVAFLRTIGSISERKVVVGDPLAGVGVRSVRFLLETEVTDRAFSNDLNKRAFELIRRNAKLNRVGRRLHASCNDANVFLAEHSEPGERFSYVDIDPFGSPAPFLDNAVMSLIHGGYLAVTATDSPVLCGLFPNKMRLMYDSYCRKLPCKKEIGVRVLIGAVVRAAARHEIGADPLICYAERNYFRAYFRLHRSRSKALSAVGSIGYVASRDGDEGWEAMSCYDLAELNAGIRPKKAVYGPMWTSAYEDSLFASRLAEGGAGVSPESDALIGKVRAEESDILGYYPHDLLAKACGGRALPIVEILNRIRKAGIRAGRTLFDPSAVKAQASFKEVTDALSTGPAIP